MKVVSSTDNTVIWLIKKFKKNKKKKRSLHTFQIVKRKINQSIYRLLANLKTKSNTLQ